MTEVTPRQEERHAGQLLDLQSGAPAQPMGSGQHGQDVERRERAPAEALVARRHEGEAHVAPLQAGGEADPAIRGRISQEFAAALKAEAKRRADANAFFGYMADASLVGRKAQAGR